MNHLTEATRPTTGRAATIACALGLSLAALVGLPMQPAASAPPSPQPPTMRAAAPRPVSLSVSTVAVGNTVVVTPSFPVTPTRVDYAWEYCTSRPGSALTCAETGVPGTHYTPTLASTGGMTLAQWGSASYFVRVRAVAYNGVKASVPTWSRLTRVVPGAARGQLPLVEWWDGSTFAVSGAAAADGVDGAIPFRVRAVRWDGVTVGSTFGNTGLSRPDLRSIWPNTGNWGGTGTVVVNGASAASTVCLDVGLSYVQVLCQKLPPRPLT